MAAQAQITVEPYSGEESENFRQFEQLFRGFVGVAAIPNNQRANFLQLHLRGPALRFFQTLPEATRNDVDLSFIALRNHFCNVQLQEVHVLNLEKLRFDPKIDTPENFLVTIQTKAIRAYPTPVLPAVAPIDPGAADAAAEQTRFDSETTQRAERLQASEDFKNAQVKRIFQKAMPGWLRSKLMEQPPNATVQELCTLARQQMTIRDLCRKEDYPEDGFNEVSNTISDNLINALSKLNANQESMEKRLQSMDERIKNNGPVTPTPTNQTPVPPRYPNQAIAQSRPYNPQQGYNYRTQNNFQNRGPYTPRFQRTYAPRLYQPRQQFGYQQTRPSNSYGYRQQPTTGIQMPRGPYMPVTRATSVFCYTCGYPNHTSSQCSFYNRPNSRGNTFPFQHQPKN